MPYIVAGEQTAAPSASAESYVLQAPDAVLGDEAAVDPPTESFMGKWNPENWIPPLPFTLYGFAVVDSWRGLSDGHFQNNNGFKKGLNAGRVLPGLERWGIGAQLGASYGLYRTTGRASTPDAASEVQQQTFVTGGLFRRATPDFPVAAAVVYDGMINDGFGIFATSPYLSQFRLQLGYVLSESDEIGFWMTQHGPGETRNIGGQEVAWRAINQYNAFWRRHYKRSSANCICWIGAPSAHRLNGDGSLGQLIFGSGGTVPINANMVLFANAAYMMPSAHPSAVGSIEDAFYVGFGVAVYHGPKARCATVAGDAHDPYLPVADNATFFVDTTRSF
jgi:uncharacterized protein DUF6666